MSWIPHAVVLMTCMYQRSHIHMHNSSQEFELLLSIEPYVDVTMQANSAQEQLS